MLVVFIIEDCGIDDRAVDCIDADPFERQGRLHVVRPCTHDARAADIIAGVNAADEQVQRLSVVRIGFAAVRPRRLEPRSSQ